MKIDLHIHSTLSDGEISVAELVDKACNEKYEVIAVTDHNRFSNEHYEMANKECGIRFVRGMEISSLYYMTNGEKREIHILALGFRNYEMLNRFVKRESHEENRKYINAIKKKMDTIGVIAPSYDELKSENCDSEEVGRVHLARWLKAHGVVESIDEAFNKYLGKKGLAYQNWTEFCDYPILKDVISVIIESKGIPVLAHPLSYGLNEGELICLLSTFKENLNGRKGAIEVFYSKYSKEMQRELLDMAIAYGLLASAGSDYHRRTDCLLEETIDEPMVKELISLLI